MDDFEPTPVRLDVTRAVGKSQVRKRRAKTLVISSTTAFFFLCLLSEFGPTPMMAVLFVVAALLIVLFTRQSRVAVRGLELIQDQTLVFEIDNDGIRVPLPLLSPGAYRLLVDRGEWEGRISWDKIEKIEVYAPSARHPGYYYVVPTGSPKISNGGEFFVTREHFGNRDIDIARFMQGKLGERLILRDWFTKKALGPATGELPVARVIERDRETT